MAVANRGGGEAALEEVGVKSVQMGAGEPLQRHGTECRDELVSMLSR